MQKVKFENSQIPLHYQISDYILIMLKRGELKVDERVPPEEELREVFDVSRTTVRRAIEHLLHKGLITRKQGKGTFWTDAASKMNESKPSGINRQIFNITEETKAKVLAQSSEVPESEVSDFLKLAPGTMVAVFKRIRFIQKEPMSLTINYMSGEIAGKIERKDLESMTMLEVLENRAAVELGVIEHEVEITRANSEISKHLKVSVLDPVLTVKTSVYDTSGNPVEIVWTHFVENKYKFKVVLDK